VSHLSGGVLALMLACALAVGGVQAQDEAVQSALALDPQTERIFKAGWAAASVGDRAGLAAAIDRLKAQAPDTPLLPYLRFEQLRQSVETVDAGTMTRFLATHRDWSFADRLERTWLRDLAERGDIATVVSHLEHTGQSTEDTPLRCALASHRVQTPPPSGQGEHAALIDEIESLWLVPRSQHDACDPAFAWWRRQGMPTESVAWSRFLMATQRGERSLAGYLKRYLSAPWRVWADRWLIMQRSPHRGLAEARQWPDSSQARTLIQWGLIQLARRDWSRAAGHWANLERRFQWSASAAGKIEREVALFQAVALDEGAIEQIDQLPKANKDPQIWAWRARVAMAHGRWEAVLESIQQMPARDQIDDRWRYWRGRALAELGRPDAVLAYGSVSTRATYYGFLSAKKLHQPLSLCPETLRPDPEVQAELLDDPELVRAAALFQVGRLNDARWTWQRWLSKHSDRTLYQAALIASALGWHDRAVTTLANAGMMRAYAQRFPLDHRQAIEAFSEQHQLDPALVYGLMRAESALQPDARSPVGARGLLQLMPQTARAVARREGLPWAGVDSLYDPKTNVALGAAHLAKLQSDFGHNWAHVAAAYNAGENAVRRWLQRGHVPDDMPADVWVETLPFYETRDYVPRVLAFATIYEWQLGRSPQVLAEHIVQTPAPAPTGFACAVP